MQEITNNYSLYIPINFPNIDLLVAGTKFKADKVRLLLHQMFLSMISQSGYSDAQKSEPLNCFYDQGYIALHTEILRLLLSSYYKPYISFLLEKKLITVRESPSSKKAYSPGFTSIRYKINSDLLSLPGSHRHFRKETIADKCAIKAIIKTRNHYLQNTSQSKRSIPQEPIHKELFKMEQLVRFDMVEAESWVDNSVKLFEWLIYRWKTPDDKTDSDSQMEIIEIYFSNMLDPIDAINEGIFKYKVCQFGNRLYSPLKMVNRQTRSFMYFEGYKDEEVSCLDISNSQVYFSSLLANPTVVNTLIPEFAIVSEFVSRYSEKPDFKRFITSSTDGTIYTVWQNLRGLESREVAKKELITVLFSRRYSKMEGSVAFKIAYPSVWAVFDYIKSLTKNQLPFLEETILDKKGHFKEKSYHCNLSVAVQRMESRFFIKLFSKSLLDNGVVPFFTIHDSVYFLSKYKNDVERIFNETFTGLGVAPPRLKS